MAKSYLADDAAGSVGSLSRQAILSRQAMPVEPSLIGAAEQGDHAKVQLLLDRGADVNAAKPDGRTPLFIAAENGRLEVVQLLLAAGATVNAENAIGQTPLNAAADSTHEHPDVVQLLLAAGADVNAADAYGRTPLFVAAMIGHLQVVQLLLAAGAAVNAANKNGRTPLTMAAQRGYPDVVQLLLAAGADVNAAAVNKEQCNSWTPLHAAAENRHSKVGQLLLAVGADVNAVNIDSQTPLLAAASAGCQTSMQQLLAAGANPQARRNGYTALRWAAWHGHTDAVQLLLEAWGQTQVPAAGLIGAAQIAIINGRHMATFARLVKVLQQQHPQELHRVFGGIIAVTRTHAAAALAAIISQWASDVSSIDEQRAAVVRRQEDVAREQLAVQQLIVSMAKLAQGVLVDESQSA